MIMQRIEMPEVIELGCRQFGFLYLPKLMNIECFDLFNITEV